MSETGAEVKMTESYMLDAYTYTEAEAYITMRMQEMVSGPFEVVAITKSNVAEVFYFDDAELWFKVKVALIFYDEESGKEKQQNQHYMLEANDVKDAFDKTEMVLKGTISSYVIASITYTKVIDIFRADDIKIPEGVDPSKLRPIAQLDQAEEE